MITTTVHGDETKDADLQLPPYSAPGRILFYAAPILFPAFPWRRFKIACLDFDQDSGVYWLNEGMGIKNWLNDNIDIELAGFYVIEDVHGEYYRGDRSWGEDDDENWYGGNIRRATDEEIRTEFLS